MHATVVHLFQWWIDSLGGIYHSWTFGQSSVGAMMNNAATDILVPFFGGTCACISVAVELLLCKTCMFSCRRYYQFCKVVYVCFTVPQAMTSSCSTSSSTIVIVKPFHFSLPGKCVMLLHCDFNLHFPDDNEGEHIWICLLVICIFSFVKYHFGHFSITWTILLICRTSLCILGISPLLVLKVIIIFLSVACISHS